MARERGPLVIAGTAWPPRVDAGDGPVDLHAALSTLCLEYAPVNGHDVAASGFVSNALTALRILADDASAIDFAEMAPITAILAAVRCSFSRGEGVRNGIEVRFEGALKWVSDGMPTTIADAGRLVREVLVDLCRSVPHERTGMARLDAALVAIDLPIHSCESSIADGLELIRDDVRSARASADAAAAARESFTDLLAALADALTVDERRARLGEVR